MSCSISGAARLIGNIALPIAGTGASIFLEDQIGRVDSVTKLASLGGGLLFAFLTAKAPGERSHHYTFGTVLQIVPIFTGVYMSSDYNNQFSLGHFLFLTSISITTQIVLRELAHLPGAIFKNRNSENPAHALVPTGNNQRETGETDLVPSMNGLDIQPPGKLITEIKQKNETSRSFFGGNTKIVKTKYRTAEGGSLIHKIFNFTGWFSSRHREVRVYKGVSTYPSPKDDAEE